jgi:hypothetical protein
MYCAKLYGVCENEIVESVHKRLQKVCEEGALSCSTLGRWARRLFVKGRRDDVAVHTQHRETDANVESKV